MYRERGLALFGIYIQAREREGRSRGGHIKEKARGAGNAGRSSGTTHFRLLLYIQRHVEGIRAVVVVVVVA